ncbi:hypothetical protein ACJMK2_015698, partial [Sinanodonta woodiana]
DGTWSHWSKWTSCSHTCGHGSEMRHRTCEFDPSFDYGNDCTGSANETRHCFFGECPADGSWGDWTTWTTCSKTCNGGVQSRNRDCVFPEGNIRGSDCVGDGEVARICNTHLCS